MKNILALFVLVCLSFSCSSNDDNSDNSSSVYGVWEIKKQGEYASANDIVWTDEFIENPCTSYDKYALTSDDICALYTYNEINGVCVTEIDGGGTNDKFIITNDVITFYYDLGTSNEGVIMRWNIIEQTSNTMTVKSQWMDGNVNFITDTRAMYLVKQ